ncbi:MAG TPA: DUF503 domain-containing protein [bacterium]|nr:DUF503 domain-containing protein [bacterium]
MIGSVRLEFHLPACHSLKEKRGIIRRFMEHTRRQYAVAIAEIESQDEWQRAVLEAAAVSNQRSHLHSILTHVVNEAERPGEMILTACDLDL